MKKFKGIFFGTPKLGAVTLDELSGQSEIRISQVVSQPDKRAGRGKEFRAPETKLKAQDIGIEVLQPEKLGEKVQNELKELNPDFLLTTAYGKIIPSEILEIPKIAALNIHPSFLPKLRGPSPIAGAILNGLGETGVTLMIMTDEVDAGDIVYKSSSIEIADDTTESLEDKLYPKVREVISEGLVDFLNGDITPEPQNDKEATYTEKIEKQDGKLDWSKPADRLEREIRAYQPWPVSWFTFQNQRIQALKADVIEDQNLNPGEIFKSPNGFAVQCGENALEILKLKPAGKTEMSGQDYLNGHQKILEAEL